MAKRTTPPLFYGEYVQPHPARSETVVLARKELMRVCNRVYPEFLEALRDCVFPEYSNSVRKNPKLIGRRRDTFPHLPTPEHGRICQLLDAWMRKFNAETEWLFDEALLTMRFWSVNATPDGEWATKPVVTREVCVGDAFAFTAPAWRPQQETWEGYNALLQGRFEKALRTYQADTRAKAEALGLLRARRKYSPQNLEWFVLYQFAGWNTGKIADQYEEVNGADESTVLKGIKAAQRLLAWECLRQPRIQKGSRARPERTRKIR